jgi:hypothetical protein
MATRSPTLEGFRLVLRRPSVLLAEITWRWACGAAAIGLTVFTVGQFLDTLPVSNGDLLFLRSGQPFLIGQALAHIFRGSAPRLLAATLVLVFALAVLWNLAASLGRKATLDSLLAQFAPQREIRTGIGSLVGLNFLRTALALAALLAYLGASILSGLVSSKAHPRPELSLLIFLVLAVMVAVLWAAVNWYLSLAAVFVEKGAGDTFSSLGAAIDLCRRRTGPVSAVSFWYSLLHLAAFVAATTAVFFPIAFLGLFPVPLVLIAVAVITLLYFVVADWLYISRLAAYVVVVETPEPAAPPVADIALPVSSSPVWVPTQAPSPAFGHAPALVDQDELILSDIPPPQEQS